MTIEEIVELAIQTYGDSTVHTAIVVLSPDRTQVRLINLIKPT